jgi:type I restriction enzyme S subunit
MDNCSRGAAGRNRPLNTWLLEREQILVPSNATQKKIAQLVTLEGKIRQRVGQYVHRAVELRSSLITAAVIGQIDVREKVAVVTKPDRSKFRVIVGAEIVHRHRDTQKLGRIKNQKLLYLAEAHAGINELAGNYIRFAAGPYDEALITETEHGMEAAGYCRAQTSDGDSGGIAYVPLANAGRHTAELKSLLGDRADALRKLIDLLHDFDKEAV